MELEWIVTPSNYHQNMDATNPFEMNNKIA